MVSHISLISAKSVACGSKAICVADTGADRERLPVPYESFFNAVAGDGIESGRGVDGNSSEIIVRLSGRGRV